MIRYEVQLGHMVINGKAYPLLVCEVLAEDLAMAEFCADYMGFPDSLVRPTTRDYLYPEYQQN